VTILLKVGHGDRQAWCTTVLIAESLATWFHAHGPFLLELGPDLLAVGFATATISTSMSSTSVRQRLRRSRRLALCTDIHDGPEQMIQSKAGYIDATAHRQLGETTCNARPDIIRVISRLGRAVRVRFTSMSRHRQLDRLRPKVPGEGRTPDGPCPLCPKRSLAPPFAALRPSHCLATHPLIPRAGAKPAPGEGTPGRVRPAN